MKKLHFIVVGVMILLALAGSFFAQNYLVFDDNIYPRDISVLDLTGKQIEDFSTLEQLTYLTQLDLRGTGLTVSQYEHLQQSLPNCNIQWLIPFGSEYLPMDIQTLTISEIDSEDIQVLKYLKDLKTVDATGCADYPQILAIREAFPHLDVRYRLTLGAQVLDQDANHISSADLDHIVQALQYLPGIQSIDASGCTDFDGLLALKNQYPQCSFTYQVPFCGKFWSNDTTEMALKSVRPRDLAAVLKYLPDVTQVTVTDPVENPTDMIPIIETHPDIEFRFCFDFFGTVASNQDTFLDISDTALENLETFEAYLPLFTNLEKVDMCRCGIENEAMAALNQRHPDTLFVWEVQMGHFSLRTDIIYFMPYQYRYQLTDADADLLKYFTELICIDFGHMDISRTDYLAYMPKLQYLMMCDTDITDISYCANMKDLKYVELFMTKVTDFSPLLHCKNLEDLNICYTNPDDPLIFAQMTQLKNLWFRGDTDWSVRTALQEALPNTRMMFGPGSSTGRGWRRLPNYYAQRDLMGMPYMEEP